MKSKIRGFQETSIDYKPVPMNMLVEGGAVAFVLDWNGVAVGFGSDRIHTRIGRRSSLDSCQTNDDDKRMPKCEI